MLRTAMPLLLIHLVTGLGSANFYLVTNTSPYGDGSLRWAIEQANAHAGSDTIRFNSTLAGGTIALTTPLPAVTDDWTMIDGDIGGNGSPDIVIDGHMLGPVAGLTIQADNCTVKGLSIVSFGGDGILLSHAQYCSIRTCHLGVNLAGDTAVRNSGHQIHLLFSHDNTIGGTLAGRNIIAAGLRAPGRAGIFLDASRRNTILNCNIGIAHDGVTTLTATTDSHQGILLQGRFVGLASDRSQVVVPHYFGSNDNVIGGADIALGSRAIVRPLSRRNAIGGMWRGIEIVNCQRNTIANNYFGVGRDASTVCSIYEAAVILRDGAKDNVVGGTASGTRNVICPGSVGFGVRALGSGTQSNLIQGNWIGVTPSGASQKPLTQGVSVSSGAGPQTIGGGSRSAGNVICVRNTKALAAGVFLSEAGAGSLIRNNSFGVLPVGRLAASYGAGVWVNGVDVRLIQNTIARAARGVFLQATPRSLNVRRNLFRNCQSAVSLELDARAVLGNLANDVTSDDGGNTFRNSNQWFIRNLTRYYLKAEGNQFPTTVAADIDAKIEDKLDNRFYGRVDYKPLKGGVMPTSEGGPLGVTAACAAPTAAGAEIAFTLSAPADVVIDILNIAGRPVARLSAMGNSRAAPMQAGTHRVVWARQTLAGTPAPSGRYLVRIIAQAAARTEATSVGGETASALCALTLP